ncbi:MAG: hypothetical protein GY838_01110 [bacterium]|nr:hypothetical protein [bacterium]
MRAIWKWLRSCERIRITVLLMVVGAFCLGARPACRQPPNMELCNGFDTGYFEVHFPDTEMCVDIPNPCSADGNWAAVDHFRLYQEPDGFFIRGQGGAGGTVTRQICISADVEYEIDVPIEISYLYTKVNRRRRPDYGEGTVSVTIGDEDGLEAAASAVPSQIDEPGLPVQLDVAVTGGVSPYTWLWMSNPHGQIAPGDVSTRNPLVHPTETTVYTCAVTDSHGDVEADEVTVTVGLNVVATVDPDSIDVGGSSQLLATVVGGTPPYTYDWVPLLTLDDATVPNPVASPVNSQLYQVTVRDQASGVGVEKIRVGVRLAATVTATPATICDEPSQLEVTHLGGAPPFTYSWQPATGLSATDIADPVATPAATTTYYVTVMDGDLVTAIRPVTVTVPTTPMVTATVAQDTVDQYEAVQLEASAACGTAPYTFHWYPSNDLDDDSVWNPVCTPVGSMEYEARAYPAVGVYGNTFLRVHVRLAPQLTATTTVIPPGGSTNLWVSDHGGGRSPYTYSWSPTTGLSNPTSAATSASPTETTTYALTITDAWGQVAVRGITVEVAP